MQSTGEGNIEKERNANKESRESQEKGIWLALAFLYIAFLTFQYIIQVLNTGKQSFSDILNIVSSNLSTIFFLIYAPSLFRLVFDFYPIEFFRIAIQTRSWPTISRINNGKTLSSSSNLSLNETAQLSEHIKQQVSLISESNTIAEKIYSRAGAYLFLGCSIAFAGITVFNTILNNNQDKAQIRFDANAYNLMNELHETKVSFNKNNIPDTLAPPVINALRTAIVAKILNKGTTDKDIDTLAIEEKIIGYLPRFGALILIELVAFFFLKQYRIMLEEYRYYEAIKRRRQENLVFLTFLENNKENPEALKIVSEKLFEPSLQKLSKEETTQVLETQKILMQETDFLGKLTDLLKAVKAK